MLETMTFGIELEITLPITRAIAVGPRHAGLQVEGLPLGWKAEHDGSIRTRGGRYGVEIVSPVLVGADGLRQIAIVCRTLNTWGAKVNPSCGCHVHIGFDRSNRAGLKNLINLVAHIEKGIWAATGTKSRERNHYCAPIVEAFRNVDATAERVAAPAHNRYHLLNVSNVLANYGKSTIEIRAFAGTTNPTKSVAYVRLCLAIVERALTETRPAAYDARPLRGNSPMQRRGDGMTALTRMLYDLGWTKGRRPRAYGALGDGAEGLPTLEASKKELRRLAKKYDAMA